MNITELTFRLFVIFFPGIIGHLLVDALTEHQPRTPFQSILHSFVIGVGSYFVLWLLFLGIDSFGFAPLFKAQIFTTLTDGVPKVAFGEFLGASIVAIVISTTIIPLILNKKWIHAFVQYLGISNKFGDLDVWSLAFNSKEVEWIMVRDLKHNLVYKGWVRAFSPTFEKNELLLQDVEVFKNDDGEKLYEIGALYIARESIDLTIEIIKPFSEFIKPPNEGDQNVKE